MQRDHNLLFYGHDMYRVLEHQKQSLIAEVNALQEHKLLNISVEDLVAYFEEKYWIDVPVLDVENAAADQKEAQVEVSGFGYGLDRGKAMQVTGTQVTLDVPFTGDHEMFKVQPSTYTLNPPRACVGNGILTLSTSGTNLSGDQVQAEFDNLL